MTAKLSTGFKRAWLRRIYRQSTPSTLLARLEVQLDTCTDAVLSGQAIASTSANGHTTSFSTPGSGAPGPALMAELADEMIRRYDEAKADLGGSPTDAQIFAKMLACLSAVRESTNSYANLRC